MEVVVRSRETIKPSHPTPHHLRHLQLTFIDQLSQQTFSPFIYFYPSDSSPNANNRLAKCEPMKKSLSEILTGLYPLAGRLKDNLFIDCNDEGVHYFEAQANCQLSSLVAQPDYAEINKLLPYPDMDNCGDMILAIQVNIFDCGGLAIGLCFARKVLDALSMFNFVNTWAAKTKGDDDRNLLCFPKFDLAKLFPRRDMSGYGTITLTAEDKKKTYVAKKFVFSASAVSALKAKYGANHSHMHPPPSRVESLSAFIFSRFMVATQGDKASQVGKTYRVVQAVNLRRRLNPPLPDSYFGNLSRFAWTVPSMEGTAEAGFGLITQMRQAVKKIDGDYVKELQEGNPDPGAHHLKIKKGEGRGAAFTFTSVSKYSLYEADFGWGKPIWITMAAQPVGNVVVLMPARSGDDMEAIINMKGDELAKLEADKVFQAFVSPTLNAKVHFLSSL